MKPKFIPIIGTISAGKSTFLKAFLGVNMLQVGSTTTTKFVCLIKNSTNISFYHVVPKIDNENIFCRDGEETNNEEEIKKRIEKINEEFANKEIKKDDLFYMLEFPIKCIDNEPLLENCYFMDIPGLNENNTTYIEDIFSIITINDILFEIMIFDSTSIGSDNILNIFYKLEAKNCLKKENNLYILNKIDHTTKGGDLDIIDSFKEYFYKAFEDEKNDKRININFSQNKFIPLNSLLYQAEKKINEDFYSLLLFELFLYLENKNAEFSSFFEFIQKRNEVIINQNNDIDIEKIEKKIKKIKDNDIENNIIVQSIEQIQKNLKFIRTDSDFQLGLKKDNAKVKKELKKLLIIQRENKYICHHSDSYNQLHDFIGKIIINNNDLSTPPIILSNNENKINNNSIINIKEENNNKQNIDITNIINKEININNSLKIINELDNFIINTLKLIDPNNELGEFKESLSSIRENILGRKIRISLIGNISVGKSTVLNCIIGEKLLPTKDTECTYRGVIIKNKNIDNYELYRTKLISKGTGYDKYFFFQEEDKPYCRGISNIKSYLKNKNNDKNISDEDAYIVIVGKLKIFDLIKLDENIIKKIEFIDLPGPDRKANTFNEKKYYEKILRFSNSCIYINSPSTINDVDNVNRMRDQYIADKNKVVIDLRKTFLKSCLFLINKSDSLSDEKDKEKIIEGLIKTIPEENISKNDVNITFFSGKLFSEFLDYYNKFVLMIEVNPLYLLKCLYNDWASNILYLKTFKYYIVNKIAGAIEEKFDLDLDEEIEIPDEFYNDLKSSFNILYKNQYRGISEKDEDEIIEKLYLIKNKLKNRIDYGNDYNPSFFDSIYNLINFSEKLQNDNLMKSVSIFFSQADDLFNKKIQKEDENEKKLNEEKCIFIKNIIIPKTNEKFKEKQKKIIDIIDLAQYKCNDIIKEELKNVDEILKKFDKNIDKAAKIFQEKIQNILDEMIKDQENEVKSLIKEIENLLKECIENYYHNKNISESQLDTNKGITVKMLISLFTSTISGIAVRSGLVLVGQTLLAGAAAGATAAGATFTGTIAGALLGPLGIAIGFGVGISISLGTFIVHYFSKSKRYKNGIESYQQNLKKKFEDFKYSCLNDFTDLRDTIIKDLNIRVQILHKRITLKDEKKWKEIQKNYLMQKDIIKKKIENIISEIK